jgi:hypothetical protein
VRRDTIQGFSQLLAGREEGVYARNEVRAGPMVMIFFLKGGQK